MYMAVIHCSMARLTQQELEEIIEAAEECGHDNIADRARNLLSEGEK